MSTLFTDFFFFFFLFVEMSNLKVELHLGNMPDVFVQTLACTFSFGDSTWIAVGLLCQ